MPWFFWSFFFHRRIRAIRLRTSLMTTFVVLLVVTLMSEDIRGSSISHADGENLRRGQGEDRWVGLYRAALSKRVHRRQRAWSVRNLREVFQAANPTSRRNRESSGVGHYILQCAGLMDEDGKYIAWRTWNSGVVLMRLFIMYAVTNLPAPLTSSEDQRVHDDEVDKDRYRAVGLRGQARTCMMWAFSNAFQRLRRHVWKPYSDANAEFVIQGTNLAHWGSK